MVEQPRPDRIVPLLPDSQWEPRRVAETSKMLGRLKVAHQSHTYSHNPRPLTGTLTRFEENYDDDV